MDNTYFSAREWLISHCAVSNKEDLILATNAIVLAAKKFPTYYREVPANENEVIEKEIFEAEAVACYMEGKVGTNQLSLYQQDVVRKLMRLRVLSFKNKS